MSGFPVSLDGVSKRYPTASAEVPAALESVTFAIDAGSMVAVAGPSGSGKSTLLHVVGGMDESDSGSIRVGEREVSSLSRKEQVAYRRTIGFVFQRFHLLPALTALDNVAAPLLPRHADFDKLGRARELLGAVGLDGKAATVPSRLSGGEQQRVAIARALINDPGLLLADEPSGNLDSATSSEIIELLLRLRDERGMTVLVATHDPVVAARCERIITLRDGRVVDDVAVEREAGDNLLGRIGRLDLRG